MVTPAHRGLCAFPYAKLILLYGIPEGVFQAGSNLSAISIAFSRKILSPERSYALRSPPKTLCAKTVNKVRKKQWMLCLCLHLPHVKPN